MRLITFSFSPFSLFCETPTIILTPPPHSHTHLLSEMMKYENSVICLRFIHEPVRKNDKKYALHIALSSVCKQTHY